MSEQNHGQKDDKYDERAALTTLMATGLRLPEADVRRAIEALLARGTVVQRAALGKCLNTITQRLEGIEDAREKRRRMRLMGRGLAMYRVVRAIRRWIDPSRLAPGSVMLSIAGILFSKRKVARVYAPLVADYRLEYLVARCEGVLKAVVVMVEHWWGFIKACGLDAVLGWVLKLMLKIGGS